MTSSKLIYEKKYPKWEMPPDDEVAESEIAGAEKGEMEHLTFEQIMERIYKDVTYVPIPERAEQAKEFVRKAIEVSKDYEIDISIEERLSHIQVSYYFNFGGGMKALTDVIGMADDIAFFGRKDNAYNIVMCLDFYTHAEYRKGRQVNP